MKKNLKRWLALLLAITMIVTSGAFTNLTYLRATDSETPEAAASAETQQETKTEEKEKEKKQEVKVEAKDDKAVKEAKKAEEEAKAKAEAEAKAEEQKKAEEAAKAEEQKKAEEAAKADEQKKAEEAAKADEQKAEESATTEEAQQSNEETNTEETVASAEAAQEGQKAEESAKEENKEQTYDITIKEPGKDGGSIRAWVGDAGKVDVSFKDGKYVKEVKEGETFHFEIETKDGYTVDKVKADKHKIKANVDGNTYTYELKDIKEDRTLNINYKKEKATDTQTVDTEETPAVESQTSETGATEEETSSDDGDVPQQEEQKQEEQIAETEPPTDENPTEPEQSVVDETQQEIRMPAQKLVATASDGAKVTVNAPEGALPEGTSVNVRVVRSKFVENAVAEAVEGEGKELVGYKAYDITIVGPDGNEIQPEDTVKVNIKNADVNGEDATVYHVENGNADKVADVSSTENANFSAEHFSIYVIAGAETKAVATYEFYDGETKVNTQKVKDGEKLNKPDVPVHDGKYFTGWFVEETNAKVDFDAPVSVAATSTVKVVARYEEAYYVYFKNTADVVVATKQGKNGDAISVDDVSFPLAADEGISGWYTDKALTNRVEGTVTLNGANVTVYPKVEKGYYITYDAEGGTYTKPVFVAPRQKTTAPAEPTRLGYTFKCWSTQQNGEAYTFGNELEKDITLHAVWEAKTVTYHVIYWKENADYQNTYLPENLRDKEQYEFDSTKDLQGYTGQQTVVDGWNGNVPAGFTLQTISQQEIKGDGSTIVNVYLNRNIYEVKFYPNGKTPICGKKEHKHNWRCDMFGCNKEEHTHTADCYANYNDKTIRAKYGANINSAWPKNSNNTTDWAVDGKDDTYQVNIDTMPLNGAIFNEPSKRKGTESATYYVEVLPGENGTNVDGKTYKEHHTDISGGTGYSVTKEDRYPITGFTLNEDISTSTGGRYNNAKFYYTRNKYNVVFNNNGETVNTVEAYYQASLSGTGDYKPTAPAGKEGYTFAGWYTNSLGEGTPFDFDTATMPARNITVYAKWVAPTFTASVHVTVDGSGKAVDITKEAGTKLLASELPTINVPEGSTFRGWYLFENGKRTTAFNFNTEIHENITLVPYWTSDTTHTVAYEANGASGNVPVDGNAYAEGAYAEVLDNTSLTGPDGSPYFTGWKSNVDDQIYYPGDKIEITADITFTAQWSNQPYTSLTYYANNGTDESKSGSYPNNETVKLEGKDLFAYNNYNFKGWNTKADGTGTAFEAEAQVIVDNIGTNALYAQWEKKEGKIGYNLTLSGATINTTGWSKTDGYKYTVDNEYYKYPDTFTVTNRVPTCAGFKFLGWFDKDRNSGGHSSSPAIRKAGDSVKFIYTDDDVYTLDALWASIKAEGATYPYDGEAHTIKSAEVAYNSGNLAEKYVKQIKDNHLVSVGEMQYATEKDGTYTSTMPTFKDVGTHDVYCKTTVQVGSTAKTLTTKATVTITPRPVTVTVTGNTATRTYTGTEQSVNGYTATTTDSLYKVDSMLTKPAQTDAVAKGTEASETEYPMGLTADQFSNTDDNFTVTVEVTDGWLKISAKSIVPDPEDPDNTMTVTPPADVVYNGESQQQKPTVKDGNKELTEGTDYTLSYSEDTTNVGDVTVTVTGKGNYTGTTQVTYKITPKPVTVTVSGATDTKTYNGTEQSVSGYTMSPAETGKRLYNLTKVTGPEQTDAKATATRKDVGTTKMTLKNEDFSNSDKNFNVTFVVNPGWIKIDAKSITDNDMTVTPPTDVIYNGNSQQQKPTVKDGETTLVEGTDYTLSYSADTTNVGTVTVTVTGKGNYAGNKNVTYQILQKEVEVTVTGANDSQTYDGIEKSVNGYTMAVTNENDPKLFDTATMVNGPAQTADVATAKRTDAGKTEMTLAADQFSSKNDNFKVTFTIVQGYMEITPKNITPNPDDPKNTMTVEKPADVVYNGKSQQQKPIVKDGTATLVEGQDYELSYSADTTNVGTVTVTITGKGNYTGIATVTYQITKRAIAVYNSRVETYDGTEKQLDLTAAATEGTTVTVTDVVTDETLTISGTYIKGTEVNTYTTVEGTQTWSVTKADGSDSTGNYTISVSGQLEIVKNNPDNLKAEVSIKGWVYDGQFDSSKTLKSSSDSNAEVSYTYYKQEADGTETKLSAEPKDDGNYKVVATWPANTNYPKLTATATFAVTPRPVTVNVTGKTATRTYTGKEQSVNGYTVTTEDSLYKVDSMLTKPAQTDAVAKGTEASATAYPMGLTDSQFSNTNNNFTVTVKVTDGWLKISAKSITANDMTVTPPADVVYNGESQQQKPTVKDGNKVLTEGTDYTLSYSADTTNVGEVTVTVTGKGNYTGTTQVTYKITPKPVTVTVSGATDTKTYNGTEQSVSGYTMSPAETGKRLYDLTKVTGPAQTDAKATAIREAVGTTTMTLKKEDFSNSDKNFNVTFVVNPGWIKITEQSIDPKDPDYKDVTVDDPQTEKYNGNEHKFIPKVKDITGKLLAEGTDYTVAYDTDNFYDVTEIHVTITGIGNYKGSIVKTYSITPREVKLISGSDHKTYDGLPLTKHTVTVSGDGFVNGEGAEYTYTGSQTYVGSSENTFSYALKSGTKVGNYIITTENGQLSVDDGTPDKPIDRLVITKSHDVEKAYALDEEVTFKITVKNVYDTPMTIMLEEKEGVTVTPGTFKNVASGKTVEATAKYKITEQDIVNGSFVNVVTASFSKDKEVYSRFQATDTVKTEPVRKQIAVEKTILPEYEKSVYALGDTIKYSIVATNKGNQTLKNVYVTDALTQDEWYFTELRPGQPTVALETKEYTVTEEDILKGSVVNVATATSDEKPEVTPGEKEVPTEQKKPSLFITKEADKTSNIKAGDVINYTITVTNNGNVTINDIEVKDNLTGDTFNKNVFNLIGSISLAPGEHREFTVRYTATQNDIVNGSILNVATVTGTDPDGNPVNDETERTVTTERANADYTVTKTVDNPKAEYKVGDVINYTIRVTNTGNLTLNNLTVTDQMQGASGNAVIANRAGVTVNGNTATIATLAVGASIELKASYTVARADADGTLANRVNVTSTTKPGEDPENPNGPTTPSKSDETDPTPAEKTYVLTIHYVDNNGNAVAPDYTARLLAGETIDAVVSPAIDGYTPNFGTVVLPATGMPAANITVTVIYTPDGPDDVLDDPEKPNQPNNGGNNGGGNAVNNNNNNANNANNADNGNNAANNNAGQADANPAPADGVIQPDDNGGYDLTPVEDTPTPLANMNLDDHACCILHFLIMLLTLIIFALYTKSRKNRQLKVEELREQLAIASIQKELDLSDEDMAKYLEEAKKLAEEKKQANA